MTLYHRPSQSQTSDPDRSHHRKSTGCAASRGWYFLGRHSE
nr:MAG TPA: hypothetical protein [Caudoviricetes sp.]